MGKFRKKTKKKSTNPLRIVKKAGDNGAVILFPKGHIDSDTYEKFSCALDEAFEKEKFKILIDMKDLVYMSSGGCGIINQSTMKAKQQGGNIVLYNITKQVQEIINLLGVSSVWTICNSQEEAYALLDQAS